MSVHTNVVVGANKLPAPGQKQSTQAPTATTTTSSSSSPTLCIRPPLHPTDNNVINKVRRCKISHCHASLPVTSARHVSRLSKPAFPWPVSKPGEMRRHRAGDKARPEQGRPREQTRQWKKQRGNKERNREHKRHKKTVW